MAIVYEHLKSPVNSSPGVADSLFIAPVSFFTANGIQCANPADPAATLGTATHVTTPHVFAVDKGFIEVICAPFKNTFGSKSIGEVGSLAQEHTLEVFIPGSYPKLHATIAMLKNQPCIVEIKDSNCRSEMYYQLGCDCLYAWVTAAEFSTGTTRDGQKGWKLTITATGGAVTTYEAAIQLLTVTP